MFSSDYIMTLLAFSHAKLIHVRTAFAKTDFELIAVMVLSIPKIVLIKVVAFLIEIPLACRLQKCICMFTSVLLT